MAPCPTTPPSAKPPPGSATAPPPPSGTSSSSSRGADTCLLLIHITPYCYYSHNPWLVELTLGIHADIKITEPNPGSFVHLPDHWVSEGSQGIHFKLDFSSLMLDHAVFP